MKKLQKIIASVKENDFESFDKNLGFGKLMRGFTKDNRDLLRMALAKYPVDEDFYKKLAKNGFIFSEGEDVEFIERALKHSNKQFVIQHSIQTKQKKILFNYERYLPYPTKAQEICISEIILYAHSNHYTEFVDKSILTALMKGHVHIIESLIQKIPIFEILKKNLNVDGLHLLFLRKELPILEMLVEKEVVIESIFPQSYFMCKKESEGNPKLFGLLRKMLFTAFNLKESAFLLIFFARKNDPGCYFHHESFPQNLFDLIIKMIFPMFEHKKFCFDSDCLKQRKKVNDIHQKMNQFSYLDLKDSNSDYCLTEEESESQVVKKSKLE